jgi:hypothetical protein
MENRWVSGMGLGQRYVRLLPVRCYFGTFEAKADLGAAEAPEGVGARTEAQIEGAVEEYFVAGFSAATRALPGSRSPAPWLRRS